MTSRKVSHEELHCHPIHQNNLPVQERDLSCPRVTFIIHMENVYYGEQVARQDSFVHEQDVKIVYGK